MPRGDEYHQPNAPNSYDDEQDSDLELELQELGPNGSTHAEFDGYSGQRSENERDSYFPPPSRADRFRAMGRRAIRLGPAGDEDQELLEQRDGERTGSSDGLNEEDGTPLLPSHRSPREPPAAQPPPRSWLLRVLDSWRTGQTVYRLSESAADMADDGREAPPRRIHLGEWPPPRFPVNAISNAKYTPWSFLPRTLYNEFSFFINMYFLIVSLSQLIKPLQVGVLWTYMAPLGFVLAISLGKEAYDDVERRRRDGEANREPYTILKLRGPSVIPGSKSDRRGRAARSTRGVDVERLEAIQEEEEEIGLFSEVQEVSIRSKDIKVGDVLKLNKNDRVPADVVILKSVSAEAVVDRSSVSRLSESLAKGEGDLLMDPEIVTAEPAEDTKDTQNSAGGSDGETFIRTDQLDGETDWKLRLATPLTQNLHPAEFTRLTVVASKPSRKVNEFIGRLELAPAVTELQSDETEVAPTGVPLSIDNTAWQNTVLASSASVLAVVVYTGSQTRAALSTAPSRSKVGLLEFEINNLTKILCVLMLILSGLLVLLQYVVSKSLDPPWYISVCRFLILFSTIIPISLRVTLDLGKTVYAYYIQHDIEMPGAIVRTSTIPEDLGRIEYLLSDKTGTLTQNEMDLRKIHVGTVSYANEAMDEVTAYVRQGFSSGDDSADGELVTPKRLLKLTSSGGGTRTRREIGSRVRDLVLALALCHNVTPTTEELEGDVVTSYQASSPDEIAIVRWTESVGLRVVHRDRHTIALEAVDSGKVAVRVRILDVFPFTSESKRMGILLEFLEQPDSQSAARPSGEIWFYQKGADTVMTSIVAANDWLDEETANMAREGLRTLVVGRRRLLPQQYLDFAAAYREASLSLQERDARMAEAVHAHLEHDLELLGVTGVEDRLQRDVKPSLELLRNAGIKIWMLTGDKVETARCVAVSAKLVGRGQHIHTITGLEARARDSSTVVSDELSQLGANASATALLVDGDSLGFLLRRHQHAFISLAVQLPAVIACRCSPTQKADVALLIRAFTRKRVACIGDGGNDVSMIQAADVGVGIVGKEGRQASLAADFSIGQFCHLTKLLVWHGRNSYKRSAKLGQFVIHRGLAISVAQTVFSAATAFMPNALFRDWLLVGYSTAYTHLPLFSLVMDRDIDEGLANLYPELYKELTPGTSLSYRTFFKWLALSVYQGALIQVLAQLLTGHTSAENDPTIGDGSMLAVAFTALVLNELGVVAMEVTIWHWLMVVAILFTAVVYAASVPFLGQYYNLDYVWSWKFVWQVTVILAISLVPPYVLKLIRRTVRPPSYRKVRGI